MRSRQIASSAAVVLGELSRQGLLRLCLFLAPQEGRITRRKATYGGR